MSIGRSPTRLWLSCLATGLAISVGAQATDIATGSTASPAHPKKQAKPAHDGPAAAAGFSIDKPPGWVHPLAYDASAPIALAPFQVLVADVQRRVQPGGNVEFRHYLRQINEPAGLQAGGQIELEFDPSYQRLIFHKIDIVRGGQRINELGASRVKMLHRERQLEEQVIDGRMTASVVLDDLRVGDRVEWEASIVGDNPVFGGRFVDSQWIQAADGPVGQWQYRLLAPVARDIRTRMQDTSVESASSVHDGVRETLFRRRGIPQFEGDDRIPAAEYLKVQLELSEFADWHDVATWSEHLFAHAMLPTPALDAQVQALKANAPTRDALLRATLDFVQHDIRYFGTEAGIGSHQPADVDTVLRQRFGDCKDKAALLAALLRRMDFDATPVLVSSFYRSATAQRLPGPLAFDHAIVRVVVDGKPLWLDGTRSQQTGTAATRQALDLGFGLPAQSASTSLSPLPDGRDSLRVEGTDTFSFPKLAEEGTLTSVLVFHGDLAEGYRGAAARMAAADFQKAVTSETLRGYPGVVPVGEPEIQSVTEDNTFKVTAHYRTGDFWTFPEQRLLAGRWNLYGLVVPLRLPDQTTRTRPFRLDMPGRYTHKFIVTLGEDSVVQPSTRNFDESNKNFELHVRYDVQSQQQQFAGELHQLTDSVEVADWSAYREALNKVSARLGGQFGVPAIGTAQAQALRTEGPALVASLNKDHSKQMTQVQLNAQFKLLVLDKELEAGRLAPRLRAETLVAKGIALDMLGRPQDAQPAFAESITLDGRNAEAHEAMAINAFFRRQDAEAMAQVDETLRLVPSNMQARYTRAWTNYFTGDYKTAASGFTDILQSRGEVERSYGAIWLYLAERRLGGDGVAAVQAFQPSASAPEWPYPVLQLMQGKIDFDAALSASRENGQRSRNRECELYFYAGEKALSDGNKSLALDYLKKSMATGVVEFNEYVMSQREIDRIKAL